MNSDKQSNAERAFATHWYRFHTFPDDDPLSLPETEYRFDDVNAWRFDFAWPKCKVAVEIEGGVFMRKGGHTSGKGYQKDCKKYNKAIELGWHVLRYTPQMMDADPMGMIEQIEKVLRKSNE